MRESNRSASFGYFRGLLSVLVTGLGLLLLHSAAVFAQGAENPDVPSSLLRGQQVEKAEYLRRRSEHISLMRGYEPGKVFNPMLRIEAVNSLNRAVSLQRGPAVATWVPLGPAPIPNGQTVGAVTPVSGRTISIAIHPTNPDIVYVGTANGGLYRTLDGGNTWLPLMDSALSLAIGAVAIAPSQPDTVYVGTGEPNFSRDSFFGVGVYRLDNASSPSPILSGPFNQDAGNADVFTGRGISEIQVHPTNPDIIFVSSTSGVAGVGVSGPPSFPSRGVYRSSNASAASPVFEKLIGLQGNANVSVRDIVLDPLNPNLLVASTVSNGGGIHVSTDALAPSPSFTLQVQFNATGTSQLATELAVQHTAGSDPVFYAATGNGGGRVLTSTDGGTVWVEQVVNGFCGGQCFYDIAIAVDPTDPSRVYLGGDPSLPFGISTNSAVSFASSSNGLHVDSHVIAVAPSNPAIIYFGSDGGIYRSANSGASWTPLNNGDFSATQFQGLATHPIDEQFLIGGPQDNGTNFLRPNATWTRADFGDGGFAAIDQNAVDTNNVRMYHTYFNATTLQGYGTVGNVANASDGNWTFRGCQGAGAVGNGISCDGSILFYAPIVVGPGTPNTVYYGSDRLYRSDDEGLNHTVVSQSPLVPGVALSTISISPNDDNIRAVGLQNGSLFRTTDGSTVLVDIDPSDVIPNVFISDIVIDVNDNQTAYVTLSGFAGAGQNVWKTTQFLTDPPVWVAAATGIPDVPVNVLVINPEDSNQLYVGTDIGVFRSDDGGTNWVSESNNLPRVPVFDMAFQGPNNPNGRGPLRIATHGRGIWELDEPVPVDKDLVFADGFE